MTLSPQQQGTIRKAADEHVTLSNDMKSTAVDEKLRTLNASIKKLLSKKDVTVEIFVVKGKAK